MIFLLNMLNIIFCLTHLFRLELISWVCVLTLSFSVAIIMSVSVESIIIMTRGSEHP